MTFFLIGNLGFPDGPLIKNKESGPEMQETQVMLVQSMALGRSLEEHVATHSSSFASEKSHGQRNLAGYCTKVRESDTLAPMHASLNPPKSVMPQRIVVCLIHVSMKAQRAMAKVMSKGAVTSPDLLLMTWWDRRCFSCLSGRRGFYLAEEQGRGSNKTKVLLAREKQAATEALIKP